MAQTILHPPYLEAAFIFNIWVSSDVKSARHWFNIIIYEPKVVYDMVSDTFFQEMTSFVPEGLIQGVYLYMFPLVGLLMAS